MAGSPWGGSEELWSQAAGRLREAGHEVSASVVWWPKLSPKIDNLAKRGVEVVIQERPPASLRDTVWRKIKKKLGGTRPDVEWLRQARPNLVVISQGYNRDGLEWMQLCREFKLPYTAIVQCNAESWWPPDQTANEMASAYRDAKRVFCVSRHNRELLESQIGEELPNAEVVWNPVNVPNGEPPEWPDGKGIYKMACVARLEPGSKGQDLLFQVLARPTWRERSVELNIYGAGMCEENLHKLAQRLRLPNVHFRGHVSEVRKIWEENHVLVLPSRCEGLPLALVEAMWCARPAVVTDIGGNAEMCVDGETGFVAAAPALGLLEQAMERAWERREDWQSLGKRGRARAEKLVPRDPVKDFCERLEQESVKV